MIFWAHISECVDIIVALANKVYNMGYLTSVECVGIFVIRRTYNNCGYYNDYFRIFPNIRIQHCNHATFLAGIFVLISHFAIVVADSIGLVWTRGILSKIISK